MEVNGKNVPGHYSIKGNEAADKLVRKGVNGQMALTSALCKGVGDTTESTQVLANVPTPPTDSEESERIRSIYD